MSESIAWSLPPRAQSVSRSRSALRAHCGHLPESVVHNAELLTSELVTNAIKHASGDITCRLWAGPDVVRLEVVDSSPAPPVRAERGLQADSGRGLRIVDTLATRWGAAAQEPGKYVWFELDARG